MSRDANIITLSGRLTRDPEMRYTPQGKSVCSFSLACNDSKDKVNFFDCQAWEKTAEIMTEYCKKGKKILIIGRLNQQRWDDQDGKKRSKNIINVSEFQFMDGKNDESSGTDSPPPPNDDEVPL